MILFEGQNMMEFIERFKTDEICKEYLAEIKWKEGFECIKCHHKASQIRKDFSRTCNRCSHTDSAMANTLFHKVKFGVKKAFFIYFEMSTSTKSLSASYMAVRYGVTEKTARLFMHKVREAMKSSGNNPMDGEVHVDEFVVGGREKGKVGRSYHSKKKKVVCAVSLTDEGGIKQFYALKISNFPPKNYQVCLSNI